MYLSVRFTYSTRFQPSGDGGDGGRTWFAITDGGQPPIGLMPRQPLSQRSENAMDGGGEALMVKVKQAASDQGVREMKEVRGAI